MFEGFKMLLVAQLPRRDTIARVNLQYADSIIIKENWLNPQRERP